MHHGRSHRGFAPVHSRAHTSVNSVQSSSGEQNKKQNLIQSSPLIKSIFSYTGRELLCCGANNTPELFNLLKARNNNSHTYGPRNLKETIVIDPRNRCFWMIHKIKKTRRQKKVCITRFIFPCWLSKLNLTKRRGKPL